MILSTTAHAAIEMRGISKRFGDVVALAGVDFSLRRQEVHVLAGENGAGKTTLMNVLAGLYQPDTGGIWVDGAPLHISSPRQAIDAGIGMVHQHFELVAPFTAFENIILGAEGSRWRIDERARRRSVHELMERYGLMFDLDARVRDLAVGVHQKIEILKALSRGARVLILDEPTTHLTPQEVDRLFEIVRQLVAGGLTVVLITHKLREIQWIGDRVTVMRRGSVVATLDKPDIIEERLVALLMGARPSETQVLADSTAPRTPSKVSVEGAALLRLEDVSTLDPSGRLALDHCSLELRPGELVGIAGVAGNGQRELGEVIVGLRAIASGRLHVGDRDLTRGTVRDRILAGIAYIPQDRLGEGILPRQPLAETLALGVHHTLFAGRWTFDEERVRALTRQAIATYDVAAPDETVPAAHLSGGNIQKVLVARALLLTELTHTDIVVAMNPTRGLDVGATGLVHKRLLDVRARGGGVLLVSEDLDELMRLSDRILVLYRGHLAGSFSRLDFDPYRIGALMTGLEQASMPREVRP